MKCGKPCVDCCSALYPQNNIERVEKQRDDLLEALKGVIGVFAKLGAHQGYTMEGKGMLIIAQKAIESAQEKANHD